ncbi:hypothetical protein SAMN05428953_11862 [Mesorhizobium muleiense]|uniref:Uncharacterized protein n=1 Tax=Mesorhizobium muleiense TaxID=1004279 RepID=A0A1G9DMA8_9HYPH|nr:hypothetical protein SAMN05428953_11862 [Mesorhizobium muleiense]
MRANNKFSGSREAGAAKGGRSGACLISRSNRVIAELERGSVPWSKPMRNLYVA